MKRRERLLLAAVPVLVALGGCAGRPAGPVPTDAAAPYACAGVPLTGAQRMSGTDDLIVDQDLGTWGKPDSGFFCSLTTKDKEKDGRSVLTVLQLTIEGAGGYEEPSQVVDSLKQRQNAVEIVADEPGAGYVYGGKSLVRAWWVCGHTLLEVELYAPGSGRDAFADVSSYVVSMLPWACGGQTPPDKTSK